MKAAITLDGMVIIRVFFWVMIVLVIASILMSLIEFENQAVGLLLSKLHLGSERNPGAFFSFMLLLTAAVLLAVVAANERQLDSRWWRHWMALAAIFVLLAYDEAAMLHEQLTEPIRAWLSPAGFFRYAWVIPGLIVVSALSLIYVPLLRALPPIFCNLFVLSGALFVGGALGFEMLGGKYSGNYGQTQTYLLIITIEETLEMAGVLLFIYSLTKYLTVRDNRFDLSVTLVNQAALPTTAGQLRAARVPLQGRTEADSS